MKIVTDAADFNIDGWEEVWKFEKKGWLSKTKLKARAQGLCFV